MLEHLKDELNTFRKRVIQQAKTNLTRTKKNASKRLYNSLGSDLKDSKNSFQLDFTMTDYGEYVDKGVSGTQKKYDTKYAYTNKMPPPSKLDKWIVRRGLAPRDKSGKLLNRKTLQFLVARSIYRKGFKPSLFFTKPFENEYKKLSKDLINAYGLDMEEFFAYTLTNYKK
jgi:hypothetical protein